VNGIPKTRAFEKTTRNALILTFSHREKELGPRYPSALLLASSAGEKDILDRELIAALPALIPASSAGDLPLPLGEGWGEEGLGSYGHV
jgi:hypothetical protein